MVLKPETYFKQNIDMAASQARIADTIDKFYGTADRTSEGAMAANAYKRSVDELDSAISRELVSQYILADTCRLIAFKDAPYRTCISEPLGKMSAYFPVVNDTISKRGKKVGAMMCHFKHPDIVAAD